MPEVQQQDPMAEQHDTELFYMLVRMISTNALLALGKLAPEGQQPPPPDLEAGAAFVDMLGMLEAKTTGNRNQHEDQIIKSSLDQLHIIFVEVARKAGAEVPPSAPDAAQPAAPTPQPEAPAPTPAPAAEQPATPPAPAGPPPEEKVKYRKSYGGG
ncbi:MAG: DUF1844 domain-containing protein [Verrucomicrobia bacterium]|nr:DUF1844 domain-containing protein [Verrucomicrobiota bacterium]